MVSCEWVDQDATFIRSGGKEEFNKEHKRRWNEGGGDWDAFHKAKEKLK